MAPLVRSDTDDFRSMVTLRSSSIYDMMLSLGALHSPGPRHENWASQVRSKLPRELLEDIEFLYSRFENGVLLMELAVDYPDHHDVEGFVGYIEQMNIPRFLFYVLGRLAEPEEMARVEPNMQSLLSIITHAFPEGCSKTEARYRTGGFLGLVSDPADYRSRMVRVWRTYWESFFAEESKRYAPLWDESITEKGRALAGQEPLEFVKRLSNHPELPEQIPAGYATSEIVLVPSYFTRRPLLFYGYGSITMIYDCQLTEQRLEQMEMLEDEIVAVGRALGDKTRLRLLRWIVQEPQAYGSKLAKLCHISQPSVSRHLRILKEAGILEERPVENHITYEVCRDRIEGLGPQLMTYLYEEE
jgi:DNA-binding transcriptional ArsR family regulator